MFAESAPLHSGLRPLVEADERNGKFLPLATRRGLEPLFLVMLWAFRDSDPAASDCDDRSLLQFGFVAR
jgi:hypothetical protein